MGGAPRAPFLVLGHFFAVRFSATIKRCGEPPRAVHAETIIQGIAGFFSAMFSLYYFLQIEYYRLPKILVSVCWLSFINEVSTIVDRLIKIAIYVDIKNFGKRYFHILRYIRIVKTFFLRNTFIANKARQNRGEPLHPVIP